MANFSVEHGGSTQIKEPVAVPQGIGGGLFREADDYYKLPPRYEIVMDTKVQRLLDTPGSVLGSSEETILEQIQISHPCKVPGGTFLYRHEWRVEKTEKENSSYRRSRRYHTGQFVIKRGWLVMERPVVYLADIPSLQSVALQHGAVLVPADAVDMLGNRDDLREAGFTVVDRRFDLVQINFAPNYARLTKWRNRVKEYEARVGTEFPDLAIAAFYILMEPKSGPEGHELLAVDKNAHAVYYEVVRLWKTVKRFWGPFWRREHTSVYVDDYTGSGRGWGRGRRRRGSGKNASYTFKTALEACLPFLHGMEKQEKYKAFCKFLRVEARAAKVKIPAAPRKPKKPQFKRRKPIRRFKHEVEQSRLVADAASGILQKELTHSEGT